MKCGVKLLIHHQRCLSFVITADISLVTRVAVWSDDFPTLSVSGVEKILIVLSDEEKTQGA